MKCGCGCGREIPNGCFWATNACGKKGRKHSVYMPANGEWREQTRLRKKISLLKKGNK